MAFHSGKLTTAEALRRNPRGDVQRMARCGDVGRCGALLRKPAGSLDAAEPT
jgi:hypothetical protein